MLTNEIMCDWFFIWQCFFDQNYQHITDMCCRWIFFCCDLRFAFSKFLSIFIFFQADSIVNAHFDVFQCPDPAQVHIYHDKFCDSSTTTTQYTNCINSRAAHYGPKTLLHYLYNAPIVENNESDNRDAVK